MEQAIQMGMTTCQPFSHVSAVQPRERHTDDCRDGDFLGLIGWLSLGDPTRADISHSSDAREGTYLTSICSPWVRSLSTSDARGMAYP